jgi:class 3 adenylate cyclase/tetratricopeptide (TPR) repeat protein
VITCPTCGQENRDGARFCDACAAPLAAEAPGAREERKIVTVLFADLVGFTSQAEQLDPEDVRAILSGYHERVRWELERYGGTVEKFIGDAVMAIFGAPMAREDDPERAVRAALAVRDAIAELNEAEDTRELHVRIAITTGETLVRLDARPEEGEGMAAGDVVNTAARLQSAAPIHGVLVDETTYRATERSIEYEKAAPVDAKGKAAPVDAYEAKEARARYGVDVRQIGRTPLVGRVQELDALRDALTRARTQREPQLVTLGGVPGIGKSRLVYELFRGLQADPDLVIWRQGRSLPYGEGIAYWALSEIVKAQAGILETDGENEAAAKLARSVSDVVLEEREAAWVERNLGPLVGLAADSELGADRRGEAFSAWRRLFEAMAETRPLVLVFEDLHFADDGLLDFVDYLVDWATGAPLLAIGTARPELLARRPGWGGGKANAITLSLSALSDTETAQIVHAMLHQAVLPAELQQRLLQRAEGNPLYAEEFARLVAEGRQPDELPESVQGIVAARLDALEAAEKRHLQDAAVLGKVFWLGAAAHLGGEEPWALEERLHDLERKEFVRRERRPSVAGETEYAFRHLLVRDVAYGQIPRAERAAKHVLAAEWIEQLGRPEDHAEMLAHQYLAALELRRAAGQDVSTLAVRAHAALREAGDRASALYAFAAAARFYGEALATADGADAEVRFRHAEALYRSGDESGRQALEDAREALISVGSSERAAEADALLAEAWWHRGDRDRCFEHLAEAEELVRDGPPSRAKARVLSQIARYRAIAADSTAAMPAGSEALAIAEELGLDEVRAHALNNVSLAKFNAGDFSGAIANVEQSIEIALAINSPEASRGYNNLSVYTWVAGNAQEALRLREESVHVAERLGGPGAGYGRSTLVIHLYSVGRWDEAVLLTDQVVAEGEREPNVGESFARTRRALIRLARGDNSGALEDARRALEIARPAKDPQTLWAALAPWIQVGAELGIGEDVELAAEELLQEVSAQSYGGQEITMFQAVWVARQCGFADRLRRLLEPFEGERPWADVSLAILDERYTDAAAQLFEIGDVPSEAQARLRAAEQHVAAGRRAEANAELERALAFYRSVGATRYIRQAETLLAASA